MELRFENLAALHWLWTIPAVIALLVVGYDAQRRALARFADASLFARLTPDLRSSRRYLRAAIVLIALVALIGALIDPRWGVQYRQVRQRGIDIMVVLDVSRSMLAEDVRPNRLERAKQDIRDLIGELAGDRVGLVTFAGSAAVKCPLTIDYSAYRLALSIAEIYSADRGGSRLGDALELAAASFADESPEHKAIIVFTDGEDHGSDPVNAAQRIATRSSIPIYTVGIGDTDEGARIPIERNGQTIYLTHDGQQVWSTMQPEVLRAVALASGGAFVPVGTSAVDMGRIYTERIEPDTKREFDAAQVRRHVPRHQWFAGLALALLLLESFIGDRGSTGARPTTTETAR